MQHWKDILTLAAGCSEQVLPWNLYNDFWPVLLARDYENIVTFLFLYAHMVIEIEFS